MGVTTFAAIDVGSYNVWIFTKYPQETEYGVLMK